MTHQITGALFKTMVVNGAAAIDNQKSEINELNVFPVPDGDTGTNMSLTMGAGAAALADASPGTLGRASDLTASALLRGARGNSGVILSLLFRGIARHLKDMDTAGAADFAEALSFGVEAAYKAVMKPAEGTILTVSRLAADAAIARSVIAEDIEDVLEHAIRIGYEALDDTINQNPVLKRAGVVDAGGKGYLYILEGMLKALQGDILSTGRTSSAGAGRADFSSFETQDIRFAYCTEFIVARKTARDVNQLRDFLDARGDSIVVVEDDEVIKVHIHTDDPGVILTEALTFGPLLSVKVENMREQHTEKLLENRDEAADAPEADRSESTAAQNGTSADPQPDQLSADADSVFKTTGVVAVCAGEGLCGVFRDLGVDNIIVGGQTMNPSTEDILKQIETTAAKTVFVLPNNKNIIMAAQQCSGMTNKNVVIIPTVSMPQGISAMIAMDPGASPEDNEALMTQAIERVHTAQITYAARDSEYDGQAISAGDYLALIDNKLAATGSDTTVLIGDVAAKLASGEPEFITVFSGADVDAATTDVVVKKLSEAMPDAEFSVVDGGQPVYYYLISAE